MAQSHELENTEELEWGIILMLCNLQNPNPMALPPTILP